ncbi:MAG TPA: nitroreductase family deazaflavin-dependent oxidoreductase [Acidimicrobiales bacterium]|nr:nitroreductase family deazaflavin-dependent oxidoreductase [Acidimicrobiales bacterium]
MSNDDTKKEEAAKAVNARNEGIIEEFHTNEGRVGGPFEGSTLLLLHTNGAKSHAHRINPVVYLPIDDKIYVFATKAGADTNPDWYHNLVADPKVSVEIGTEKFQATAKPLLSEERDRVYAIQANRFPTFADYQSKTTRIIPVVELVRT